MIISVHENGGAWRSGAVRGRERGAAAVFEALDRLALPNGEFFLGEMGRSGPISYSGTAHEFYWHDIDGGRIRPPRFPLTEWLADPPAHILARQPDRMLVVTLFSVPVSDPLLAATASEAIGGGLECWYHEHDVRFTNLEDGRIRPGFIGNPLRHPDHPVRLPRARIDDVAIESSLYFGPTAPLISAEAWLERSEGAEEMLGPVIPAGCPPSVFKRFMQALSNGGVR